MAFAGLKDEDDLANMIAYLCDLLHRDGECRRAGRGRSRGTCKRLLRPTCPKRPRQQRTPRPSPSAAAEGAACRISSSDAPPRRKKSRPGISTSAPTDRLPDGHGTVAQGEVYSTRTVPSCHGDFGEAVDRWPVLAGGQDTLSDDRPVKTIGSYWPYLSTVYDYVRRAMPFGDARSLSGRRRLCADRLSALSERRGHRRGVRAFQGEFHLDSGCRTRPTSSRMTVARNRTTPTRASPA